YCLSRHISASIFTHATRSSRLARLCTGPTAPPACMALATRIELVRTALHPQCLRGWAVSRLGLLRFLMLRVRPSRAMRPVGVRTGRAQADAGLSRPDA